MTGPAAVAPFNTVLQLCRTSHSAFSAMFSGGDGQSTRTRWSLVIILCGKSVKPFPYFWNGAQIWQFTTTRSKRLLLCWDVCGVGNETSCCRPWVSSSVISSGAIDISWPLSQLKSPQHRNLSQSWHCPGCRIDRQFGVKCRQVGRWWRTI